jgi:pimeloyl-ACP methyl ester carboxylesterase
MSSQILHSSRLFCVVALALAGGAAAASHSGSQAPGLIPLETQIAVDAAAKPHSAAAFQTQTSVPTASFDAGMIHVDQYGSGKHALVLIPGLACGPWVWRETIVKFSPRATIYAITLPGFDGRAATDRKELFASFAKDFWAMLADKDIKNPVVIGHSLGGTLAIALAEEHPERLAGIVAVDGLPVFPTLAFATAEQRAAAASQFANVFASLDASKKLANQEQYMRDIGTIRSELVEPAAQCEARSDMKAVAAWIQEDLSGDLRPQLARIVIPFLEVMPYNPADAKPPMNYSQEQTLGFYRSLVAGAPRVSVMGIAPSRHFVMLDQPAAFEKEIEDFLVSVYRPL